MANMIRSFIWTAGLAIAGIQCANAAVYDLAADFSLIDNPNGVWSYNRQGTSALPAVQFNWAGTGMDGWTTTFSGIHPPAWLVSNGFGGAAPTDIIVHSTDFSATPTNVTWTSPSSGLIDVTGQAWDIPHVVGRDNAWSLSLNGVELAHRVGIVGVAKGSANAQFVNNVDLGMALSGLPVHAGDVLMFDIREFTNTAGKFTGVALSIDLKAVPIPSAILLFGSVIGSLFVVRRRAT